ncbi:GntR family transcriptional regulator [Poritiphilus flavus]|uniref:GntR family transcriptional regulator n=1 Tax=Poritiphilus flavus TaxID=2697053 RepID=A0A6L9E7H7_9FLAO|nr:GntR family transcriptional regulator [Poritiphilus flavus]NAS10578.1 GntR family transcriptional regulator [Poritiphilus flavus]
MSLIDKILKLKEYHNLLKHEQLVQGVMAAIDDGLLQRGDQLPSINNMVDELGYARKTIVKAYEELKDRGLVESKKLKGYFIISEETRVTLRIALLLFAFHRFQEEFYNTFRTELGKRFQIDVFFHHNNPEVFETIFSNIQGKYGKYVVAPIPGERSVQLLSDLPPEKLLIVDRYIPMPESYSYISQEFEESTYARLVELLPDIRNYSKFILIFGGSSDEPEGMLHAFNRFVSDYDIDGEVLEKYELGSIQKGNLYFFVSDAYIWDALKDCQNKEYQVGRDIGILSHDDHLVKEIVFGGITTISTNFKHMAKMAADHIKGEQKTQIIMPMELINRHSL